MDNQTKPTHAALRPAPNPNPPTIYVNGKAFSNPLYLKGMEVAVLQLIIAGMCLVIYGYNIIWFKHHRLTKKMVFFPFMLFPAIIDNIYDFVTGGDVTEFDTGSIVALLIIMVVFAVLSMLYTALYTYDAYVGSKNIAYSPLNQEDDDDGGGTSIEMTLLNGSDTPQERRAPRKRSVRWDVLIDHMTANVIWAIASYNMMLILIYAARYISHTDHNYMREVDVAIVSLVLIGFLVILGVADFFLFNNPANGALFMQYVTVAFFALSLTISFQAQVGYCEILTLVGFLAASFMTVYRLAYMEITSLTHRKED